MRRGSTSGDLRPTPSCSAVCVRPVSPRGAPPHLSMAVKQRPMSTLSTSEPMTAQISLKVRWLDSRLPATKMQAAYTALLERPLSVLNSWVCVWV